MILATAKSTNGVIIRLTKERWQHITNSHLEINPGSYSSIIKAVNDPDIVLKGDTNEFLAVRKYARRKAYLVVPYREVNSEDGFILTAYITTDLSWLLQKEVLWSKV